MGEASVASYEVVGKAKVTPRIDSTVTHCNALSNGPCPPFVLMWKLLESSSTLAWVASGLVASVRCVR